MADEAKSVKEIYGQTKEQLTKAGVPDAGLDVDVIIEHVCGRHRRLLDTVTLNEENRILQLAARRAKREPLQYIIGTWPFMGLQLEIGEGVLIPRQDTEEVCLFAADILKERQAQAEGAGANAAALDLCAGSGALALGLQSMVPKAKIAAAELYDEAYGWLCKNIEAFAAENKKAPKAVQSDVLEYYATLANKSLDLIVSNPPYVTQAEYETLAPELMFEPKTAFCPPPAQEGAGAKDDGLLFYNAIAKSYLPKLKSGGALVFEIGTAQVDAVKAILRKSGYASIEAKRDLCGRWRIVYGYAP